MFNLPLQIAAKEAVGQSVFGIVSLSVALPMQFQGGTHEQVS